MTGIKYNLRIMVILVSIFILRASISHGAELSLSTSGVGTSERLILDDSTDFYSRGLMADGCIIQDQNVRGSGDNSLKQETSGESFSLESSVGSSGDLSVSRTTAASKSGAAMSSSTEISGASGYLANTAISNENSRYSAARFDGKGGNMNAELACSAGQTASIGGKVSVKGVSCIEPSIQDSSMAVTTRGIYPTADLSLGGFSVASVNIPNLQDKCSYSLGRWRFDDNPRLSFCVKADSILQNEISSSNGKMSADGVCAAIFNAASTWDKATSQQLFNGEVTADPDAYNDRMDWKNTFSWKPIDSDVLATTHTWYACGYTMEGADGKSYLLALDSDTCFNSNKNWVTSDSAKSYPFIRDTYDVETVALHEMGHTFGLSDVSNGDKSQIMGPYDSKQRTLGAGDIAGIQKLYGK